MLMSYCRRTCPLQFQQLKHQARPRPHRPAPGAQVWPAVRVGGGGRRPRRARQGTKTGRCPRVPWVRRFEDLGPGPPWRVTWSGRLGMLGMLGTLGDPGPRAPLSSSLALARCPLKAA